MKAILISIFTCLCFLGTAQSYEIVLATDFDGEVSSGSKEALIKAIRSGQPVRVGYQLDFNQDKEPDFDHWIEATFITILGTEVFTQIDPIFAQGPNISIPQIEIFPGNTRWTAVIGTNGKLLNRYVLEALEPVEFVYDETQDLTEEEQKSRFDELMESTEAMKEVKTWKVATFWSVPQ